MTEPITPHTALTAAMHYADRIIDPWHEGYAESTERLALVRLATATRVWLDGDSITASEMLTAALDGADKATDGKAFNLLMALERAVKADCRAAGCPIAAVPGSTGGE